MLLILLLYLAGLPFAAYLNGRFDVADSLAGVLIYPFWPIWIALCKLAELGDEHRSERLRKKTGRGW